MALASARGDSDGPRAKRKKVVQALTRIWPRSKPPSGGSPMKMGLAREFRRLNATFSPTLAHWMSRNRTPFKRFEKLGKCYAAANPNASNQLR